jgi:hypothetical protein
MPVALTRREIKPGDAGTAEWCAFHGFAPADLERHRVWRFGADEEERIIDLFRDVKPNAEGKRPHIPTIRRVVRASGGGLVFRKFPLPGHDPIPHQLDPDKPVATNPCFTQHKHDRELPEGRKVLARVRRGRRLKLIPNQWVKKKRGRDGKWRRERVYGYEISIELAEEHINRSRGEVYDPKTGEGDHRGINSTGEHRHAPRKAKYVNFGDNQRIDVGPDGLEPWRTACEALLILEGKKKHLAAEAHDWAAASVLSITMWDRSEVRWLGRWIREHNPDLILFVMPDGDWKNFERNRGAVLRQSMYVLHELRELGVRAFMLTTPVPDGTTECECKTKDLLRDQLPFERVTDGKTCRYCGGYLKAIDDWYGAGGATDDLVVFIRETPTRKINEHVLGLPIHGNAKPGRARALRGLSLHDRDGLDLLNVPLKTLQKITAARRPKDVPEILDDLRGALEIEGSLEIVKREYPSHDLSVGVAWDWVERPTIRVKPEFRAVKESAVTLADFPTGGTMQQEHRADVIEIDVRRRTDRQREVLERIDRMEARLAETLVSIQWNVRALTELFPDDERILAAIDCYAAELATRERVA